MKPVLIIDNDKDFVRDLLDLLHNEGFVCDWVLDPESARHALRKGPCMIIMDTCLNYPTEGFKLINTLRNPYGDGKEADIPILIVTDIEQRTGINFKKIAGTRLLPVDGYLSKPADTKMVLAEMKRILATPVLTDPSPVYEQDMIILCLNCGSSSVKYKLYNWTRKETMANGVIERVGQSGSTCLHDVPGRKKAAIKKACPSHQDAVELVLAMLVDENHGVIKELHDIRAVGHRVVHGGERFAKSIVIDDEAMKMFEDLVDLAPLHNPPNIIGINAARGLIPGVPHVAVMDTAWHQTIPEHVYTYALPYEWYQEHQVRKYGFHGTSLLYVSKRCAVLLGKDPFDCNLVICHIGNGVSLNAVKYGVSYDTSMGFTPLEGLVMGTRAGDHDAAVDLFIMQKKGYTPDQMNAILNKKSGLFGVSGKYVDQRDLLAACAENDKRARLAFNIESYRLKKYIGAYVAALGHIDALAFTAGVGEMGVELRAKVLNGLEGIGIKYSPEKNLLARTRNGECEISAADSRAKIYIIPTDEERVFIEDVVAAVELQQTGRIKYSYRFQFADYNNRFRERLLLDEFKQHSGLKNIIAKMPRGG
jgi:acetate kinase